LATKLNTEGLEAARNELVKLLEANEDPSDTLHGVLPGPTIKACTVVIQLADAVLAFEKKRGEEPAPHPQKRGPTPPTRARGTTRN
jgi:hypothetical protein